ncbi:MAG: tRNA 2-thiouridine(34) synthase MnmA [Pseudomonadales bacterium]|jgi:tRNA-specific 2-thiouridylase|nr:tRNA 2-thiouridine(34) synthase MnmA [Pseudomonadales bacterium]MDP6473094.1 tRNA 2-thiouridine(34) synthase MnmA [Pseudomonadales bacterium]MDP6826149.1 tRNA 2-thiouridine(34) synthase MnmA [Pseudomonadales bacterium]MDP6971937.1 tRNA 2-thiouridine(34) synthase MnmA [Pseudomonadales bacterium]|tara:strand:+ start:623 stop:1708 length:1086 start_codon:yes stop_codon:yes gene_type:complete
MRPGATIIVGMSGGVDSSVAAWLLLEAGYAVEGLFMKNWEEDDGTEYCTALVDLEDAQRVASRLGITLHTANFAAEYWDDVFDAFLREYRAGRTPNPDILCNREIKFKQFADYARHLGADAIATGHYARLEGCATALRLKKGLDPDKDQSYFLQAVTRPQFENCLFPLGDLLKPAVRAHAKTLGFHNAQKKDSTGICFIGERRFSDFLERYVARDPGHMCDTDGRIVGEHIGLAYYTIGQRQGLGIGGLPGYRERPWYVMRKDKDDNRLIVTQDEGDLASNWLSAGEVNWLVPEAELPLRCHAKVRYRQPDQVATVSARANGTLRVAFDDPQRAVTPGQYVCFYDHDVCLGGAVIESAGSC